MGIGLSWGFPRSCYGLMTTLARTVKMTPVKTITEESEWRDLERQLAGESSFDRLLEREEEMEAKSCGSVLTCPQQSAKGNAQVRWLQRALNRVSSFGIAENGVSSNQTRRALQKFQAERGLRPTGDLGPKTRAALIRLSGIPPPRPRAEDDGDALEAEMEAPSGRCPIDTPYVIRGFNQYSDDVRLLPARQVSKLVAIASEIVGSQSSPPGVARVTEVVVVGHADLDVARERREPGFLQFMSEKRARASFEDLFCKVIWKNRGKSPDIRWTAVGRGAKVLAVSNPQTEAERKCNRRVEIILGRNPNPSPRLDLDQRNRVAADHGAFKGFYRAALQGTSGQYDRPQLAEKKAREIADRVVPFLEQRKQNKEKIAPGCSDSDDFLPYFGDAIQGAASKFTDTDIVISKAAEAAEATQLGFLQETRKLEWKYASLPQPMAADCEIVRGKVPGSANHALCGTHGHILDTTARIVISHNLDEYKKQFPR
jgi:hypothetical protein